MNSEVYKKANQLLLLYLLLKYLFIKIIYKMY